MKRPRKVPEFPPLNGSNENSAVGNGMDLVNTERSPTSSKRNDVDNQEEEVQSLQDHEVTGFSALQGIGETADSEDEDSDGVLEVLALADLPSQVIDTHRNDEAAMNKKLADISIFTGSHPRADGKLGFRESLSVTMLLPEGTLAGELANDDLKREERFAEIATESVHRGLAQLRSMNIKFRRPPDYFAEMVKTDNHMSKVKARLLHEQERIEAAQKNRHNRELKKNKRKLKNAQAERKQAQKQKVNEEINAVKAMNQKRLRDRASSAGRDDDDDDFPIDLLDVEELKENVNQFVKAPSRPKANVGRKKDKVVAQKTRDGNQSRFGARGGHSRHADRSGNRPSGVRNPISKLGSKKRPGKSRRIKVRSSVKV